MAQNPRNPMYNASGKRDPTAGKAIIAADKIIKFTIPLQPVTKKNSQAVWFKRAAPNSKSTIYQKIKGLLIPVQPFITQSEVYKQYENDSRWFLKPYGIDKAINVKAIYYMKTRHKVDLNNLHSALHDVLVKHGVVADDNSNIIKRTDGSEVRYDSKNPRTEVEITFLVNTLGKDN